MQGSRTNSRNGISSNPMEEKVRQKEKKSIEKSNNEHGQENRHWEKKSNYPTNPISIITSI